MARRGILRPRILPGRIEGPSSTRTVLSIPPLCAKCDEVRGGRVRQLAHVPTDLQWRVPVFAEAHQTEGIKLRVVWIWLELAVSIPADPLLPDGVVAVFEVTLLN